MMRHWIETGKLHIITDMWMIQFFIVKNQ